MTSNFSKNSLGALTAILSVSDFSVLLLGVTFKDTIKNDNVFKEKGKKCIYIYFLREMLGMWVFSFAEAWGN